MRKFDKFSVDVLSLCAFPIYQVKKSKRIVYGLE